MSAPSSAAAIRPGWILGAGLGGLVVMVVVIGGAILVGSAGLIADLYSPGSPSPAALSAIPPGMLGLYQAATEATCPVMPWQILAAIGTVESDNGTSDLPGVATGANSAGAEGPMQFEPASFNEYALPVPRGGANPASPYDATDSIWAAARMLCADGAGSGDLSDAIYAYNHSGAYVALVWDTALSYGMAPDGSAGSETTAVATAGTPPPGPTYPASPAAIISAAESQLGVAYLYGGDAPGVALDCSALVTYAFGAVGISLPRTTFSQVTYGVTVPINALAPGDLLFFVGGEPPSPYGHVGIYMGNGLMINAAHTGGVVSITPVLTSSIELARRILEPTKA